MYDELLTFFPKDIPQNAINAQLYYSPAFLQAGEQLHLYYIDESMTNELFMRKYQNKAIANCYQIYQELQYITSSFNSDMNKIVRLLDEILT